MTPSFIDDPAVARADSYRRGKLLTISVVLGTAAWMLYSSLQDFALTYAATGGTVSRGNPWMNLLGSVAIGYLICQSAWRGGGNGTGCLTIIYSMGLVGLALLMAISLCINFGWQLYQTKSISLTGSSLLALGHDLLENVSFYVIAAWIAFAFWVLAVSPDARFYRENRRRGILLDQPPKL